MKKFLRVLGVLSVILATSGLYYLYKSSLAVCTAVTDIAVLIAATMNIVYAFVKTFKECHDMYFARLARASAAEVARKKAEEDTKAEVAARDALLAALPRIEMRPTLYGNTKVTTWFVENIRAGAARIEFSGNEKVTIRPAKIGLGPNESTEITIEFTSDESVLITVLLVNFSAGIVHQAIRLTPSSSANPIPLVEYLD